MALDLLTQASFSVILICFWMVVSRVTKGNTSGFWGGVLDGLLGALVISGITVAALLIRNT